MCLCVYICIYTYTHVYMNITCWIHLVLLMYMCVRADCLRLSHWWGLMPGEGWFAPLNSHLESVALHNGIRPCETDPTDMFTYVLLRWPLSPSSIKFSAAILDKFHFFSLWKFWRILHTLKKAITNNLIILLLWFNLIVLSYFGFSVTLIFPNPMK